MHHNRITSLARVSIHLSTVLVLILSMFLGVTKKAAAQGDVTLLARSNEDHIEGNEWPLGSTVSVEIDDPQTGQSPDKSVSAVVGTAPWNASQPWFEIQLTDYDLKPGDIITATDGITPKQLTVKNIQITDYDLDAETVTGTADPGQLLFIQACMNGSCAIRDETADQDGNWSTDFSIPGEQGWEQDTADIRGRTWLDANINDEDGDMSRFGLSVPNPIVSVRRLEQQIHGYEWPLGASATLTIDDPNTAQPVDYTDTQVVGVHEWNPNQTFVGFDISNFALEGGQVVTLTDGSTTKTHIVSNLVVTETNPDTDVISGTAEPNADVWVEVWSPQMGPRHVVAASNGSWTADYSAPGDEDFEQDVIDLVRGAWGETRTEDSDGDNTGLSWSILNPNIIARLTLNQVDADGWLLGTELTITIEDPQTVLSPDYADTGMVESADDVATSLNFAFGNDYTLKSGDVVSVEGGGITRTTTVADIHVTNVDAETDIVSGTAGTGITSVNVRLWSSPIEMQRDAEVVDGVWSADFSTATQDFAAYDIQPGDTGVARWFEGDGDFTTDYWEAPNPTIVARLTQNEVEADGWPVGTLLSITIDDPTTGSPPEFSGAETSQYIDPQDPRGGTSASFFFDNNYTLKPGDIVTVAGGEFTRTTVVADIQVTEIDVESDIIFGTAGDGITSVNVRFWSSPIEMQRDAEVVDGIWSADFSVATQDFGVYDIQPGDFGVVRWFEGDGDFTTNYWQVPGGDARFHVQMVENNVEGYDWPVGSDVTLTIDDPGNGIGIDFTDTQPVIPNDYDPTTGWIPFYDLGNIDLEPGMIVTMDNGTILKTHTVTDVTVTGVDLLGDTVSGTGTPGAFLNVQRCDESGCLWRRWATVQPNGTWEVDFSVTGPGEDEQLILDIVNGIVGEALEPDEDGDHTDYLWAGETPQCQPGNSITGTVYEHDGTTPIHNASIQIEDFNTGEILFTALTDQNGQFGCTLPNGDYRVLATRDNYSREYFDQAHAANAAQLTITTGTQLTDVNFTLSHLATMEHLTFNLDNPLLQELNVRQAIILGTNRQEILNEAFLPNGNFGVLSNSIVPPEHWASAPDSELTLYPYDPTQAEAILDAAGWINRDADVFRENISGTELAFTFKTTQAQLRVEAAELFRQYMEDIGIHITVETIPAGEFFGDTGTVVTGDFDIAEFAWGGSYDDETYLEQYITGHDENHSGYSSAAFDTAMTNAAAASTEAEKLTYYYEAQATLSEDLPVIPYFTRYDVAPVTTDTGNNVIVSPESYLDITFDEVTDGGATTVLITNIDPADLPPNFQVLGEVYDIGTSASFTSAQVCFSYDDAGLTLAQEESVRLLHLENGSWVDVTDNGYPDTTNNDVCGTVTGFSPFAIAYSDDSTPPAITWIGEIDDGDTFYFGFVPPAPSCTAEDTSGVDGSCTVTGYATFLGEHTLTATASDYAGNTAVETRTYNVLPWTLNGFYQPVDMHSVYNLVKNGSTVPLKFEIFAGSTELTDPALIQSLTYAQTSCGLTAITDEIEATVTGGTSLRYDASTGQFVYNWKTPRAAGNCYRLTVRTVDGSTLIAYFKLK